MRIFDRLLPFFNDGSIGMVPGYSWDAAELGYFCAVAAYKIRQIMSHCSMLFWVTCTKLCTLLRLFGQPTTTHSPACKSGHLTI